MATKLLHRKSGVAGHIPSTSQLAPGEIAINTADGFLYALKDDGTNPEEVVRFRGQPLTEVGVTLNEFSGNGTTTNFSLSRSPEDEQFAFVTINGVQQQVDAYSLSNATLTFSEAPADGDSIEVRVISVESNSVRLRDYKSYIYSISSATTSISGTDDFGSILEYDLEKVEVYYNGVRLVQGLDYTATNGNSIELNASIENGTIEVVSLAAAALIDNSVISAYQAELSTTAEQFVDKFSIENYRSAKYLIQMTSGTDYHTSEVMVLHDGSNVYLSEYGTMYTNNSLGTVSADILNGYVRILVTPTNITTVVKGHKLVVTV
jgi:hypothetical protein